MNEFLEKAKGQVKWEHESLDREVLHLVRDVERLARDLRDRLEKYQQSKAEDPDWEFGLGYGYKNIADAAYRSLESRMQDAAQMLEHVGKFEGTMTFARELEKFLQESEAEGEDDDPGLDVRCILIP